VLVMIAVLVDATLVRCLLVSRQHDAAGRANWWAPGPLRGSTAASARVKQPPPAPPSRIPRQSSSQ